MCSKGRIKYQVDYTYINKTLIPQYQFLSKFLQDDFELS